MEFPKLERLSGSKCRITYPHFAPIEFNTKPASDGYETSIDALHPLFKPKVVKLFDELGKALGKNYRIQVNNTIRDPEQAQKLAKANPKYSAGLQSPHIFGMAIDISIVEIKSGRAVTSEQAIQNILESAAKKVNAYWGGWFKNMPREPWHFQYGDTITWKKAYETGKEV